MRRFVQSRTYLKVRAATGAVFVAFGVAIIARTVVAVGLIGAALVPIVLGLALVALGTLRIVDYVRLRKVRP